MKVLLISPGSKYLSLRDRYPYGLYTLAAELEAHGHSAPVLDLELERKDLEEVLRSEKPDVLGITAVTHTRFEAFETARVARRMAPHLPIIAGGPHFTFAADDTLHNIPEIDAIVRGEGEQTLREVIQQLEQGQSLENIPGLSLRLDGQVIHAPDRPPIQDLDSLAPLHWDRIPLEKYNHRLEFINLPCVPILTSRGCPIRCTFCAATHMWGRAPRRRNPVRVVAEIAEALARFQLKGVRFNDDALTLSRAHILGLCDAIEKQGLKFSWACQVRVDSVDYALLSRMQEAGCYYVAFGVESGSPRLLDLIQKKITLEQVRQTATDCQKLGLKSKACFMFALPDETEEERYLTFKFIDELSALVNQFSITPTIIYPGTAVEQMARARGILPAEFSWSRPYYNGQHAAIGLPLATMPLYTEGLTSEEIVQINRQIKTERRIASIARTIQTGSPGELLQNAGRYLIGFTRIHNRLGLQERLKLGKRVWDRLSGKHREEE